MRYEPPTAATGALRLHCNEGALPPCADATIAGQYPDTTELREALAQRLGRPSDEVLVTAGADGAIDRVMRAYGGAGKRVVVLDPTFSMIPIYARQSGAEVVTIPWDDEFPEDVVADVAGTADVVALVTPDNPTGRTIDWETVARVAATTRGIVLLDLAYVEYADEDYTDAARDFDNIVVTRTMSKAWGLAGLRVGYAVATPERIDQLAAVGSPYPVSSASLQLATQCLAQPGYVADHVATIREEVAGLGRLLEELGARPTQSQANFVFARFCRAAFVADALAAQQIAVRRFDDGLENALRIGCPGDSASFERLSFALRTAMKPDAILFDMDGVLADVSTSYRSAIRETCATFGVEVTDADISASKRLPNSNDDFVVTQRLICDRGVTASLTAVTEEFQARYDAGLWRRETLLVNRDTLADLGGRYQLGVVTGRPRPDAERFIESQGLADLFDVVICREDAPLKPSPEPVRLAMARLDAQTAWMLGDTVDDICAARNANALAIGVTAPSEQDETTATNLATAGAARVFQSTTEALKCL